MSLHVATDLDGTISFSGRTPSARIRSALAALMDRDDASVTVATSRSPRVVDEWFSAARASMGSVCCNGAIVASGQATITRTALDPIVVRMLVKCLRDRDEHFCLEYGDMFAASHPDALPWMGDSARQTIGETSPLLDGVLKISIATGAAWIDALEFVAGDAARVYPHLTGDADVVARGASKAAGVRRLLTPDDHLIALGNDRNDLDLLLAADRAIVVGSALPELDGFSHVRRVRASSGEVLTALRRAVAEHDAMTARERLAPADA